MVWCLSRRWCHDGSGGGMRFAAARRRWRWAPPRPTEGFLLSVCECVCACPCMHWVRLWSGGAKGATEKPGHTTGPRVRQRNFFFLLHLQTNPDTILKTGHHISCQRGNKLAGEVEGREKHDTSCLGNNGTTAPEGVGGLFSSALSWTCQADRNKGREGMSLGAKDKALTQGAFVRSPFH